jgi:hypothetical protein
MRTLFLFLFVMGTACAGGPASAQTAASATPAPTPPAGPLLNKAPDFASWTIVSQRVPADASPAEIKSASAKAPEIVTTITKTNQTRHYVTRHRIRKIRDGSQEEVWQQGPYLVTHESMWQAAQLGFASVREDLPTCDFPEFGWISAGNFVDVEQVEGKPCLVFDATIVIGAGRPSSGSGRDTAPSRDPSKVEERVHEHAWIDLETRLPRMLQEADMLSHYTFQAPPTDMLALPPADQAMINAYSRDNAARLRPPQAP